MATIIVPGAENPPVKPQSASYAEIVAACPKADAEFIVKQLAAGVTVAAAQGAWMTELAARAEAADAKAKTAKEEGKAEAEAAAKEAAKRRPGVDALRAAKDDKKKNDAGDDEPDEDDDPEATKAKFSARVHHYMETRKVPRTGSADQPGAIQLIAINDPKLHHAYLKAINPGRQRQRILDEKFDTAE